MKYSYILSPKDWLLPVNSMVTGQEPFLLQDWFGRSGSGRKSVLTALYWGAGTCIKGVHSEGLAMAQAPTWSKSEYWTPHTFSRHWSPCDLVQMQPHLFWALSSWLFTSFWSRTSNRHSRNGNMMSLTLVLTFLFCQKQCHIWLLLLLLLSITYYDYDYKASKLERDKVVCETWKVKFFLRRAFAWVQKLAGSLGGFAIMKCGVCLFFFFFFWFFGRSLDFLSQMSTQHKPMAKLLNRVSYRHVLMCQCYQIVPHFHFIFENGTVDSLKCELRLTR